MRVISATRWYLGRPIVVGIGCLLLVLLHAGRVSAADPTVPAAGSGIEETATATTPDDDAAGSMSDAASMESAAGSGGDETASGADEDSQLSIEERVQRVFQRHQFTPANARKDPFKPLVEKQIRKPDTFTPPPQPEKEPEPKKEPPPPPLKMSVLGIVGNPNERLAMVLYEGRLLTLSQGQAVDGRFKVVGIEADHLVVYSNRDKTRRTFALGDQPQ